MTELAATRRKESNILTMRALGWWMLRITVRLHVSTMSRSGLTIWSSATTELCFPPPPHFSIAGAATAAPPIAFLVLPHRPIEPVVADLGLPLSFGRALPHEAPTLVAPATKGSRASPSECGCHLHSLPLYACTRTCGITWIEIADHPERKGTVEAKGGLVKHEHGWVMHGLEAHGEAPPGAVEPSSKTTRSGSGDHGPYPWREREWMGTDEVGVFSCKFYLASSMLPRPRRHV